MDWQRLSFGAGIAIVGLLLLIQWNQFDQQHQAANPANQLPKGFPTTEQQQPTTNNQSGTQTQELSDLANQQATVAPDSNGSSVADSASIITSQPGDQGDDLPSVFETESPSQSINSPSNQGKIIRVTTDVLDLGINTYGGNITYTALNKHFAKLPEKDQEPEPLVILNQINTNLSNFTYIAESGLIGKNGTDSNNKKPIFNTELDHYELKDDQQNLKVTLKFLQQNGVVIEKIFSFNRESYLINISYQVQNQSSENWSANLFGQIKRDNSTVKTEAGLGVQPFLGAAMTTEEDNYKKYSFKEISKGPINHRVDGGWIALVQHYFVSAWIPNQEQVNQYQLRQRQQDNGYPINLLSFVSPQINIPPGASETFGADFYVGPKVVEQLESIAKYLDLTIDYGWLWWLSKPLLIALKWIQQFAINWGLAIILLTVAIKLLLSPLSAISYKSMAKMRKLQPKMKELQDRYGNDRQKMSMELMKLYSKEGANPMSGCFPGLIQMPVFIALYWSLIESVELRHAGFLYINDLSSKDPFFILPLLMGTTTIIQQRLSPTPTDPTQAKIMRWMPVMFIFFFLWFPSGLVIYWIISNLLSIAQQWYITRQVETSMATATSSASSDTKTDNAKTNKSKK